MASIDTEDQYPGFASRTKTVLSAWLKEPLQVSSVVPSSAALTRCIACRPCVRSAKVVVDLGPATGETTQALLDHMLSTAKLVAIEKSEILVEPLRKIRDPRLSVFEGDAAELPRYLQEAGAGPPQVVVSGIPFSSISTKLAARIMDAIYDSMAEGGVFIAYQVSRKVCDYANPKFGMPEIESVWRNLPPLKVFTWVK